MLQKEVIRTCLAMNAQRLNTGKSGNVSVRNAEGFLITPSGVAYDKMEPDQVVQMDLEGGYYGATLPSSEWRMHMDIYRSRPEAGAVVHTHAAHATAVSCLRADVPAFHYMIAVAGGDSLRCAPYESFGTQALSTAMLKAMEDRSACLLANHGMICFGADLTAALALAAEVETLCRQYILARQIGEPAVLDDREMSDILRRFKTYGKQTAEMDAHEEAPFQLPVRRDS